MLLQKSFLHLSQTTCMGLTHSVILVGELFPLNSKDTLLDSVHRLFLLSTRGHLSDKTGGQTHPLCFLALLGTLQNRPSTLDQQQGGLCLLL